MGFLSQEVAFRFDIYRVGTTVTSLVTTNVDGNLDAFRAVISCEVAQLRFRYDGGDPNPTTGHILNPGDHLTLEGRGNIRAFKVIRAGPLDGEISVTLETI